MNTVNVKVLLFGIFFVCFLLAALAVCMILPKPPAPPSPTPASELVIDVQAETIK